MSEFDEYGRFAAGNQLGRLPQRHKTALSSALRSALTPERVVDLWEEAWRVACSRKSPRSMVQVLEVGLNYAYGKPLQTLAVHDDSLDRLADILRESGPLLPRAPYAQVIDVEPVQLLDNTCDNVQE